MSKKNSKLDLVKIADTSSVKKTINLNCALMELDSKIAELGDLSHLVDNPSLVLHVCNLVENISKVVLSGLEKKDIVIKIVVRLFPVLNNDADKLKMSKLIDFICSVGILHKVSSISVTQGACVNFLKRLV